MYGFEPIPELYDFLKQKYAGTKGVEIMPVALYDSKGTTTFQHVVSDPAYSGIRKRRYAKPDTEIRQITVETALLDDIIPETYQADLIKIDVEGAEFHVMKGAEKTIKRCKPIIIFEFGLGAADFYGSCPDAVYDFLVAECGMKLSTLKSFLDRGQFLRREEFKTIYEQGLEYYFVASA
jgi:FkbM family methyltransferase